MPELDPSEPTILLIGTIDSEGVVSRIKAAGRQYKIKRADSSFENWATISAQFESLSVSCVLLKLTGQTYAMFARDDFAADRDLMLAHIARVPHVIFAHQSLLTNAPDQSVAEEQVEEDNSWFGITPREIRYKVNSLFASRGFEIIPYSRNAEITVLASEFISDTDDGLLFRIYVPSYKVFASETDRLIQLFRDYLGQVGHSSVRLDQRRTQRGVMYEMYSVARGAVRGDERVSLAREFDDFKRVLDFAINDPAQAEAVLKDKGIHESELPRILTRYAKEAKRLQVDLRHEREQKLLSLRQRLESELADLLPTDIGFDLIGALAESAVPSTRVFGMTINDDQRAKHFLTPERSLTLNISPQIVNTVNAVIAREIHGDLNSNANDKQILDLIGAYGEEREAELGSAMRELADENIPLSGRLSAKQRLKGFLWQIAAKAPEFGMNLLQSYLESKIKG